jgi:hypothetical protein
MKTKKLALAVIFIVLSLIGYAQTAIGPVVGYNFAEIEESENVLSRENDAAIRFYNTPGFIRKSIVLGIRVDQNIYKWFSTTFIPSYTRKKLVDKVAPTYDLKYNIYSLKMILNIEVCKNIKIGVGPAYNYLNGFNYQIVFEEQIEHHFGFVFSSSYQYTNFIFDLGYKRMKNYSEQDSFQAKYHFIKSSNSFQFSINYMFSFFNN